MFNTILLTLVSRIEDPASLFYSYFFHSLHVLFGSIYLIVFQEKIWSVFLGTIFSKNLKNII